MPPSNPHADSRPILALTPQHGGGHQFVCYADSCSGVPGAPHAATFASVNAVVDALRPRPEFICFPGDEIIGLTGDADALRRQWRYWFEQEMAWLDRAAIPLYHTTGNHTTYDAQSEALFREMLPHLPQNGPAGQEGLSYFVRRGNLLLVFVNTLWSGLGGEGRVETAWLDRVLTEQADARYKLVLGHHPVHPVNGFSGAYQREIAAEHGRPFWEILVKHDVLAYICSHILAFDVQVHGGVLQILTAGAGTAHRMPEGIEYLHCVQMVLDTQGMRYQVLDTAGAIREWLTWPVVLPPATEWNTLPNGTHPSPMHAAAPANANGEPPTARFMVWRFSGVCAAGADASAQTLLSMGYSDAALPPLWMGLTGPEQRVHVLLSPTTGRSPHLWHGPTLARGEPFDLQIGIHTGMGPGGILWRTSDAAPWSSLTGASPWGTERLTWPEQWSVGQDLGNSSRRPFRGAALRAQWHEEIVHLW